MDIAAPVIDEAVLSALRDAFKEAKMRRRPRGFGDSFAAALRSMKIDGFIRMVLVRVTGKNCGCTKRQVDWNRFFPYEWAIWKRRFTGIPI